MNCLRCGNEIPEGESFCESCRADMEKYPVPEDSFVMIPRRDGTDRRQNRKPQLSSDEKVLILSKRLKRGRLFFFVLTLLLILSVGCNVYLMLQRRKPVVGQNYSTVTSTSTTAGSLPTEG